MAYTNFIGSGVSVNGAPLLPGGGSVPLGNTYFFVNSVTGSDGNEGTADAPFGTLAWAITKCTANTGCVIVLQQGHAETITSNTALPFNVAGVTIVGLGTGADRPTFTLSTANTNRIPVSAANIKIQNCIFIGNFLSIATCFLLTTAPNFTVDSCAFRDTSAILGFLSIITTTVTVNADGLTFTNNTRQSGATTTPGPDIVIAGTIDRVTVVGNTSWHSTISNNVAALINHGALVVTNLDCGYNKIYSVNTSQTNGALLITSATTGSGVIYNNYVRTLTVTAFILITAAAVQYGLFNNYVQTDPNTSGELEPGAGTN